ncbi:MAG: PTS sugar transporter subunit IIA [Bacillota bacterium]
MNVNISNLVNEDLIKLNLKVNNKEEVLNEMINIISNNGNLKSKEEYYRTVFEREEQGTTGVGNGLAIPHGKSDAVSKECFAIVTLNKSIEWQSIDSKPVELVIMLAVPNKKANKTHIKLLSKLSSYLMDDHFRKDLMQASSKEEILDLITKKEEEE